MIYCLASFSQATLSPQFPLWLHQLFRAKITIYLCGTHIVSSLSTAVGPLVEWGFACIYLFVLRKGGWVWRKEQIYPSNLGQSLVISLLTRTGISTQGWQGVGSWFPQLILPRPYKKSWNVGGMFSELLQVSCRGKRFTFCCNLLLDWEQL